MADRPSTIGPYRVIRQIGEGGMGVVFEARDDRLDGSVAIKTLKHTSDVGDHERFRREARAAASVSHPNICQVFDIGVQDGAPFLAMELLDGRPLSTRLTEGPVPAQEAIAIALSVLAALTELHRRGIIHRDLKPSNIFLTTHGVKLLDFGLARGLSHGIGETVLTQPGIVVGTPQYMAPEQARGLELDARTDIFALGAVLFEMLRGRPAFTGPSAIEVLHAVLNHEPFGGAGSTDGTEIDRVLRRALEKSPPERYQTAEAMAAELSASVVRGTTSQAAAARVMRRLIVLPFRMLRADAETEFLAYSLPDAITVSLSGLDALLVRSSFAAARFGDVPDLRVVASEAAVDAIVMGTLLRAGAQIRVAVQLVEAPSGTLLWSHSTQVPMDELFQLQDRVAAAVVSALSVPVTPQESRLLRRDVPVDPDAYAAYLRANRLCQSSTQWEAARALYEQSVAADPGYAPAWAMFGRCLRLLGKYGDGSESEAYLARAEQAFQRAFQLNPDLSIAHNLYTYAEVESERARQGMVRLIQRLHYRSNDPELFSGLVHACRYCGLLNASIAADQIAKRLDPGIRTSAAHTHYLKGDYRRAIALDLDDLPYLSVMSHLVMGEQDEVRALFQRIKAGAAQRPQLALLLRALEAIVDARPDQGLAAVSDMMNRRAFRDPEGWYHWSQALVGFGDHEGALALLARAIDGGFHCPYALEHSPFFAPLRGLETFTRILAKARLGSDASAREFVAAGGPRLLGLTETRSTQL